LTFQNHTDCPLTDFGGKTSIFSHPVYLFLRKFSLQDSRGGSVRYSLFLPHTSHLSTTDEKWFFRNLGGRKWMKLSGEQGSKLF
ncbi:hypothetical protein RJP81_24635, partial [Escherichia coli]|uniref:hypothetical protein n=1 Tax=Escherichia coli TaxID=562 RepID=UPI0028771404